MSKKKDDAEYGLKETPPVDHPFEPFAGEHGKPEDLSPVEHPPMFDPKIEEPKPEVPEEPCCSNEEEVCDYLDQVCLREATDDQLRKVLSKRLSERLDDMPEQLLVAELEKRGVTLPHLTLPECERPF